MVDQHRDRYGVTGLRGQVNSVRAEKSGSALAADAAIAATVLYVDDASDFAETGGTLALESGDKVEYNSADMDADSITLAAGLTEAFEEGDFIRTWPVVNVRWANVDLYGEDDPLVCQVPHHLNPWLPLGSRQEEKREEVVCIEIDDVWYIWDVLSRRNRLSSEHASNNRIFRYTSEGVGDALYRGVPLTDEFGGNVYATRMKIKGGAVSVNATYDLLKNGVSIQTLTVLAGQQRSAKYLLNVDFDDNDRFRVEYTDPKDSTPNIVLWVYVQLDND